MGSRFTHEDGRTWTWAQRSASLKKTNLAIKEGNIPSAAQLGWNRCGQKLGTIEYHNHDYDDPIKFLEPLCWQCHMRVHSPHPESAKRYFAEIAAGKQYPPITRNNKGSVLTGIPLNNEPVTITTTTTKGELIDYIGYPCIRNWKNLAKMEQANNPVKNGGICGKCMF